MQIVLPKVSPWRYNLCFPLGFIGVFGSAVIFIAMSLTGGFAEVGTDLGAWAGILILPCGGAALTIIGLICTRTATSLEVDNHGLSIRRKRWGRSRQWRWQWEQIADIGLSFGWLRTCRVLTTDGKRHAFLLACDQGRLASVAEVISVARSGALSDINEAPLTAVLEQEARPTSQEGLRALRPPHDGKDAIGAGVISLITLMITALTIWSVVEVIRGVRPARELWIGPFFFVLFGPFIVGKVASLRRRHYLGIREGNLVVRTSGLFAARDAIFPRDAIQCIQWFPSHRAGFQDCLVVSVLPWRGDALQILTENSPEELDKLLSQVSAALGLKYSA